MLAAPTWAVIQPTALGTLIGVGLLSMIYAVIRTAWPVHYASLNAGDYGIVVNRGALRYFGFAILPVYLVILVVSTTVGRVGGHAMACALAIGSIHISRTQFRHIFVTLRQPLNRLRLPSVTYGALMTVLVGLASFAAGLGPGPFPQVVPAPHEFFNAFWTTAFVAVLTAFVLQKSRAERDAARAVDRSLSEVGPRLLAQAQAAALEFKVDVDLVTAILLTENLQRPSWVRRLERLRGVAIPRGTYGVMQVASDKPLSDAESITVAVSHHLAGTSLDYYSESGTATSSSLHAALLQYSPDKQFVQLANDIYYVLRDRARERT